MNILASIYPEGTNYALIAFLSLISVYAIIGTSRRKRLLSIGKTSNPTEAELLIILSALNAESNNRLFSVSRHSVVTFRGYRLVLVWGDIGELFATKTGVKWNYGKHLYALGLAPDRESLNQQTDVLSVYESGNSCSVYFIKNWKLLEKDINSFQQSVPGCPPRGAGSPDP